MQISGRRQLRIDGTNVERWTAFIQIVQIGEPVLRQKARELTVDEIRAAVRQLVELMRATMYDAPGGGLAAPHMGLPFQLAVLEDKPE